MCVLKSGTFHTADMKEQSLDDGCSTPASVSSESSFVFVLFVLL